MKKIFFLIFLFCFFYGETLLPAQEKTFDILIKNAIIFDGEDAKGTRGDVGITGERIAAVGNLKDAAGFETVDARGLVLAPGFIDAHTHSDFNPLVYPDLTNKILQGVTTEVTGNCGMSAAPVSGPHTGKIQGIWAREGVQIPAKLPWTTFGEYRAALEAKGMETNFAGLVGHGNLRSAVMGFSPAPATLSQIQDMQKKLAAAMREGASGISFGLIYLPSLYAQSDEIIELCREAGRHSGVCAFHMRSESGQLLEAIQEVLRVARETKTPIQISHLKAAGRKNWEKIEQAFKLIESARQEGLDIEADVYPYTGTSAELAIILPDELYRREDRIKLFRDLSKRDELLDQLRKHYEANGMKWDAVMIGSVGNPRLKKYEGKTIKEIAVSENIEPELFLIKILAETNFEVSAFSFSQSEEVVRKVISQSYVDIGSDSVADGSGKPHPRAYGTFPKIFRQYVRGDKTLSLGGAIRKITSQPARHFRLKDRGLIKPGYFADLVLFDASEIKDNSDYEKSTLPPAGVQWVVINGKLVVKKGKPAGVKAGRFIAPGM